MSLAMYLAGVTAFAVVVTSLAAAAVVARRRWLSGWSSARARLAEAVLLTTALVVISQVLGTVGLLTRPCLVLTAGAVGAAALMSTAGRARTGGEVPPLLPDGNAPAWSAPAATLVAATVTTQWASHARNAFDAGMTSVDSLHYHLPFAARFAQTGRISELTFLWLDPVWSFYPHNAELLHAVGMVAFGHDYASPVLNLLWLGVGLLASWVLGRPFGVPHVTLGLTALVWAAPLFARGESGSALSDAPALALFVASLALLAQGDPRPAATAIAGAAAGLAVGMKVTAIAPVFGVTVVVLATAWRGRRSSSAVAWLAAMAAGGGYWFLRNWVGTGSPMPAIAIPGLPSPRLPAVEMYGFSVADYLGDGRFWQSVVPSGLRHVFGPAYPVVLAVAAIGLALGVWTVRRAGTRDDLRDAAPETRLRRFTAAVVAAGIVGGVTYVVTPVTAYGPRGNPFLFAANVRYTFPALVAALVLAALWVGRRTPWWTTAAMALTLILVGTEVASPVGRHDSPIARQPLWFAAVAMLWAGGWLLARRGRVPGRVTRRVLGGVCAVAAITATIAGFWVVERYLERRYTIDPVWAWAQGVSDARIAVVAYPQQYPLFGADLSNHVQYLGRRGGGGSFMSHRACDEFRRALHAGDYDYLVAGSQKWGLEPAPERRWAATDPIARPTLEVGPPATDTDIETHGVTVFRLERPARQTPAPCA